MNYLTLDMIYAMRYAADKAKVGFVHMLHDKRRIAILNMDGVPKIIRTDDEARQAINALSVMQIDAEIQRLCERRRQYLPV